jgi:aspartate aminotransferase-like enzyme
MGLSLFGPDEDLNSAVTAAYVPEGIDGKQFVQMLFKEHGIQIAGGQGQVEGRIFRIGHCGYFDAYDIIATIAAAELALESLGFPLELGKGVGAAQRVFSRSGVAA